MPMDVGVLVSMVTGGAFLAFLQFLIQRHDAKSDKKNEVEKRLDTIFDRLDAIEGQMDRENAIQSRIRILIMSDEIRRGVLHSKEYFDQVLSDVTVYKHYCKNHPEFENSKAVLAIENVEKVYAKCLDQDDFL